MRAAGIDHGTVYLERRPPAPTAGAGGRTSPRRLYGATIRTAATGARVLNLPLTSAGAEPIDLIRRPETDDEDTANPFLYGQRYFAQASLRILFSDRAADITNLPGVTATAPLQLDGAGPLGYVPQVGPPFRPPIPMSPGPEGLVDVANGLSLTRLNAAPGGAGPFTLTMATAAVTAGPWNNGVPAWLKWNTITVAACAGSVYDVDSHAASGLR